MYHVAADYRLWARDPRELYRANVDGTRHVLTAAAVHQVGPPFDRSRACRCDLLS